MVQEGALTALASAADSSQVQEKIPLKVFWSILLLIHAKHIDSGTLPKIL